MNKSSLVCLFALLATIGRAAATVTVSITPTAAQSSSAATVTFVSGSSYDVAMSTTYNAAPVIFTIAGATTDSVRSVTMNANNAQIVFVSIRGPSDSQDLYSLGSFSS